MADYESWSHGGATFPLSSTSDNPLLLDADPAIFYLTEFIEHCLEKYMGTRFMQEIASNGPHEALETVAQSVPWDPAPYVMVERIKYPLLAVYRSETSFTARGIGIRQDASKIQIAYILPPLEWAREATAILGALTAAKSIIDNRLDMGFDPTWTPTNGTEGQKLEEVAGLDRIVVERARFGAYPGIQEETYPAVIFDLIVEESDALVEADLEVFAGATIHEDLTDNEGGTVIADVVIVHTNHPDPTVTLAAPSSGTKAGGTAVTLTCTGLIIGAPTTVFFGGEEASSVVVVSATSITCVTPPFTTFGATELVDVYVVNDGRTATLDDGFTFSA